MYVCMYVCTKSFLKTTTNSSCVCTHLANKADSDSDSDLAKRFLKKDMNISDDIGGSKLSGIFYSGSELIL